MNRSGISLRHLLGVLGLLGLALGIAPRGVAGGGNEGTTILPFAGGDGFGTGGSLAVVRAGDQPFEVRDARASAAGLTIRGFEDLVRDHGSTRDEWVGVEVEVFGGLLRYSTARSNSVLVGGKLRLTDGIGPSQGNRILRTRREGAALVVFIIGERRARPGSDLLKSFERVDAVRSITIDRGTLDLDDLRSRLSLGGVGDGGGRQDVVVGLVRLDGRGEPVWAGFRVDEDDGILDLQTPVE